MPIKVRCRQCSTVMTVSDKARGRAVKCRKCGGRVRVGPAKSAQSAQQAPARRPDRIFEDIDLRTVEDKRSRICPGCASPVTDEDVECPKCGVTIATGILSQRERKRRARKGPPPEEFYGEIWGNGWKFVMANRGWAVRTAIVWSITCTMAICAAFSWNWYIDGREIELRDSAEGKITVSDDSVVIDLRDDDDGEARYDGKRYTKANVDSDLTLTLPGPRMGAIQSPPALFWSAILLVSILGFGGWAWTLAIQIVQVTMAGVKRIKRFQTDLFASMAIGFRSIFWPIVLLFPLIWIPPALWYYADSPTACGIACACIFLLPLFTFLPPALVHMTQEYTYRGWLINWLTVDLLRTFVPAMYVSVLLLLLVLAVPLGGGALLLVYWDSVAELYTTQVENQLLGQAVDYNPDDALNFLPFTFYRLPLLGALAFTSNFVIFGILAFPTMFMMRVYGLFGRYFRPDLALLHEQPELKPVGFGPRFLAFLIDCILLVVMAGVAWFIAVYATKLFGVLYNFSESMTSIAYLVLGFLFQLSLWALYFSSWEAGQNRATLGKVALRIIVLREDDEPMTVQQAFNRSLSAGVTALTAFAGFFLCVFRSDHRALHDILSKTKVVWRGEDIQA